MNDRKRIYKALIGIICGMFFLTGCGSNSGIKVNVGNMNVGEADVKIGDINVGNIDEGVYMKLERDDVYSIELITDKHTGIINEEGTEPLSDGWFHLIDNQISEEAKKGKKDVTFTVICYGEDKEIIAEESFVYKKQNKRMELCLSSEGKIENNR